MPIDDELRAQILRYHFVEHRRVGTIASLSFDATSEDLFESPRHPYTRTLLSAVMPAHPDGSKDEIVLSGEIPSPLNPPAGCRFNPRCPEKMGPICEAIPPALRDGGVPRQLVACHLYPE